MNCLKCQHSVHEKSKITWIKLNGDRIGFVRCSLCSILHWNSFKSKNWNLKYRWLTWDTCSLFIMLFDYRRAAIPNLLTTSIVVHVQGVEVGGWGLCYCSMFHHENFMDKMCENMWKLLDISFNLVNEMKLQNHYLLLSQYHQHPEQQFKMHKVKH